MRWVFHQPRSTPSDSGWCEVKRSKVSVPLVALVVGAILLFSCALWAVAVQHIVPDICHYPPTVQELAGPIRCEK